MSGKVQISLFKMLCLDYIGLDQVIMNSVIKGHFYKGIIGK